MAFAIGPALATSHDSSGEVIKIDKSAGKITLKHGPIKNLDMDSMTMVFRVADPAHARQGEGRRQGQVRGRPRERRDHDHDDGEGEVTHRSPHPIIRRRDGGKRLFLRACEDYRDGRPL